MSATKEKLYRHNNLIERLSKTLSEKFWNDPAYEGTKDRLLLCAIADAIHSTSLELDELVCHLSDPDDNDPQSPDKDMGETVTRVNLT